ncbi:MAG: biotin/lipoyl-containing protein, partial [Pseudomonadota bacterium]
MGQTVEVKVPDIGDFKDVEVIEVLVKEGDTVAKDQSLITVESDKASMEIPSPAAGRVQTLRVKIGDKVSQGSPILMLEASEVAAAPPPPAPAAPAPAPAPTPAVPASPPSTDYATDMVAPPAPVEPRPAGAKPHASPSVRKFARELGVDLTQVAGTG